MRIGIVSDTHDDEGNVKKMVRIFKKENIENVIHLGDYVAPPTVRLFKDFKLTGIFGNNDGYKFGLMQAFSEIGGTILGDFGKIILDGLTFALYHGEFREISEALAKSGGYDVVLCGHFHKSEQTVFEKTLLLNPGNLRTAILKKTAVRLSGFLILQKKNLK